MKTASFTWRAGVTVLAILAAFPCVSAAQMHAHGSAWIHRNDAYQTMLHARDDSLCEVTFPSRCWGGGMMPPDSLYCRFWTVPPESLPQQCLFGYGCAIQRPDGRSMMTGGMMGDGFFRQPLHATFHYDAAAVRAGGFEPDEMALVCRQGDGYQVVTDAISDLDHSTFEITTSRPLSWYGVMPRKLLPVASTQWGVVKGKFR